MMRAADIQITLIAAAPSWRGGAPYEETETACRVTTVS